MSQQTIQYIINIAGNANNIVQDISNNVESLNQSVHQTTNVFQSFKGSIAIINLMTEGFERANKALAGVVAPGMELESSMADLAAISGETGEILQRVEGYARDMAKEFGISASAGVESFKLLLGQLSPELAKQPAALKAMGENVAILSKGMGGDAAAAAEVLTTAMNQYGVSVDDPMEASRKMAEMMNTMAAAGREGSAELPQIKAALEQAGMAANAAGVSFEETNAAIQVLDKAGRKGSEGGVALRNVMTTLARGRFLPKDVQEELALAGVNTDALSDKSLSLSDRLKALQPIMQDDALLTKLFGRETSAAAMALLGSADAVDEITEAITGTTTAQDQASIVMETTQEKMARMKASVDDLKVGFFNLVGSAYPYIDIIAQSAVEMTQLMPLFMGFGKMVMFVTNAEKMRGVWTSILAAKTWLAVGAQNALNIAMTANPIGLVIVAIAALAGLVYAAVKHFESWGAAIMFLAGPIGWVVNAVMALKNNWDSIVEAFRGEGIIGGLKRIGIVLLDTLLYPIQQLLELVAKIPGMGNLAGSGAEKIAKLRERLNLVTPAKKVESADEKIQGIKAPVIPGMANASLNNNTQGVNPVNKTTEAVATGGTRNTQITINLGKMVENIVFNGSIDDNRDDVTSKVEEILLRALYAAQSAGS